MAVAVINEWPCRSEAEIREAAYELAEKQNLPRWTAEFEVAQQLHRHFLHRHLDERGLSEARQATRNATLDLLVITGEAIQ